MSNASDNTLEFQCPKCARRLKASAKAAGKRLKCPGCGQPVKVPGPSTTAAADDDWLNLEPPSAPAGTASKKPAIQAPLSTTPSGTTPSGTTPSGTTPSGTTPSGTTPSSTTPSSAAAGADVGQAAERSKTSIFDDDLPELAELEAPRPRVELGGILGLDDLEGLVPPVVPPQPAGQSGTGPSKAGKPEESRPNASRRTELKERANQQYRVPCPACGTPQYVTVADKGKSVKCPDCFLDFKIPPPPPGWKPSSKPATTTWGTDLMVQSAAEDERDAARARSRADEYLRTAEQELNDAEIDSLYQGDFDTQTFMRRTFGFCYDAAALAQVVAHSVLFAIGFAAVSWSSQMIAESPGFVLISGLGVPLIFLIVGFPMFAAAMTLLESVANGEPRVSEWPGFSFFDHIGELILFAVALAAAAAPGFFIGGMIGRSGGMAWMLILSTLFSTFLLFPIILLSMLDNDSIFGFVSGDVLKSLSSGYESWAVYYFKTFVAFSIIFIAWAVLLGNGLPLLAAVAGALLPWLVFFTSQQLGVLAGDISEHLSITVDRAKKQDEEPEEV